MQEKINFRSCLLVKGIAFSEKLNHYPNLNNIKIMNTIKNNMHFIRLSSGISDRRSVTWNLEVEKDLPTSERRCRLNKIVNRSKIIRKRDIHMWSVDWLGGRRNRLVDKASDLRCLKNTSPEVPLLYHGQYQTASPVRLSASRNVFTGIKLFYNDWKLEEIQKKEAELRITVIVEHAQRTNDTRSCRWW